MLRRRWIFILVLLLGAGLPASADQPVGVLRVVSGPAWINGKAVTKPALVREGERLKVGAEGSVLLKLLGGANQVVLEGEQDLTLSADALKLVSKRVTRNNLKVDLVDLKSETVGGVVERATDTTMHPHPSVRPILPLGLSETHPGLYKLEFTSSAESMQKIITHIEVTEPGDHFDPFTVYYAETQNEELKPIFFRTSLLKPGHTYSIKISTRNLWPDATDQDRSPSIIPFRILTDEERALLESQAPINTQESLLAYAQLAATLGQMGEALNALDRLQALKGGDKEYKKALDEAIIYYRRAFETSLPSTP